MKPFGHHSPRPVAHRAEDRDGLRSRRHGCRDPRLEQRVIAVAADPDPEPGDDRLCQFGIDVDHDRHLELRETKFGESLAGVVTTAPPQSPELKSALSLPSDWRNGSSRQRREHGHRYALAVSVSPRLSRRGEYQTGWQPRRRARGREVGEFRQRAGISTTRLCLNRPSCPPSGPHCCGTTSMTSTLAGVPVHVVAARLGHADPAVTLRVYSHVLREHAAGVGDIFAQAVNGAR
jgi:hypothetical protein